MKEEVKFDRTHVTSLDWNSYPILRFGESPKVTAIAISCPQEPSTGAGEEGSYVEALKLELGPDDEILVDSLVRPGHASTPGYADPNYPVEGRRTT